MVPLHLRLHSHDCVNGSWFCSATTPLRSGRLLERSLAWWKLRLSPKLTAVVPASLPLPSSQGCLLPGPAAVLTHKLWNILPLHPVIPAATELCQGKSEEMEWQAGMPHTELTSRTISGRYIGATSFVVSIMWQYHTKIVIVFYILISLWAINSTNNAYKTT